MRDDDGFVRYKSKRDRESVLDIFANVKRPLFDQRKFMRHYKALARGYDLIYTHIHI